VARILIVEDDRRLSSFLAKGMRSAGFTPTVCCDSVRAAQLATDEDFDLVLLDLELPGQDGLSVLRTVRAVGHRLPVVVLTGHDAVGNAVDALNSGADDYVTKPFSFEVLIARVRARLRDSSRLPERVLRAGDLELDRGARHASFRGERVELTFREFAILETFARHPGQVLTRDQLVSHVWGHDHTAGSNVVDVYVRNLRAKLALDAIETVRGVGYRLPGDDQVHGEATKAGRHGGPM
jgi:two-component system, OmpR family, copper resistance phosphate regulon response regulator CusR